MNEAMPAIRSPGRNLRKSNDSCVPEEVAVPAWDCGTLPDGGLASSCGGGCVSACGPADVCDRFSGFGALTLLGLSLLLAGARRTSRRGREARRGLTQSRRKTAAASQDRDDLIGQRETARAYTASTLGSGPAGGGRDPGGDAGGGQRSKWHLSGPRSSSPQAAAPPVPAVNGPAPDVPADTSAAAD
jgi:hypothetical protein